MRLVRSLAVGARVAVLMIRALGRKSRKSHSLAVPELQKEWSTVADLGCGSCLEVLAGEFAGSPKQHPYLLKMAKSCGTELRMLVLAFVSEMVLALRFEVAVMGLRMIMVAVGLQRT